MSKDYGYGWSWVLMNGKRQKWYHKEPLPVPRSPVSFYTDHPPHISEFKYYTDQLVPPGSNDVVLDTPDRTPRLPPITVVPSSSSTARVLDFDEISAAADEYSDSYDADDEFSCPHVAKKPPPSPELDSQDIDKKLMRILLPSYHPTKNKNH